MESPPLRTFRPPPLRRPLLIAVECPVDAMLTAIRADTPGAPQMVPLKCLHASMRWVTHTEALGLEAGEVAPELHGEEVPPQELRVEGRPPPEGLGGTGGLAGGGLDGNLWVGKRPNRSRGCSPPPPNSLFATNRLPSPPPPPPHKAGYWV